ncbi:hypothetical protein Efla_004258 [Eimeria flavescens]
MTEEDLLLSLCDGCKPLAEESRYLGVQFASVGPWKLRVVAIDCEGPLKLLGDTAENAVPLGSASSAGLGQLAAAVAEKRPGDKGLTAFFVHGGGGRAGQFKHLIHYFAQRGVRCIAPDLPGHGVSQALKGPPGGPSVCSIEEAQTILKATFDSLAGTAQQQQPTAEAGGGGIPQKGRRRAILVGHSFGCLQALRLYAQLEAENRADEVAALCLLAADTAEPPLRGASWLLLSLPRFLVKLMRSFIGGIVQRLLYSRDTRRRRRDLLQHERQIAARNSLDAVAQILADINNGAAYKEFQGGESTVEYLLVSPHLHLRVFPLPFACWDDWGLRVSCSSVHAFECNRDAKLRNSETLFSFFSRARYAPSPSSRPPVLLVYGEEDSLKAPGPSASAVAAALGGGALPLQLPSAAYLGLPYTATVARAAAAADEEDGSEEGLTSPHRWAQPGAVSAVLVGHAGHNVMLEQPQETNRLVWDFVKQQLPK